MFRTSSALRALLILVGLVCPSWALASDPLPPLGVYEALRIYTEFADGTHRGMYDPATGKGGYPDENYDATTAMVVNWHRRPETPASLNARLHYRRVHPAVSPWGSADGESHVFWNRSPAEQVNRVLLTGLIPNSVYEFRVREGGQIFRFRTMPATLAERPLKIIMTGDHQQPTWTETAHTNARLAAIQKPDLFVVGGDYVNCEGQINSTNATRWATYLHTLYGVGSGYFHYSDTIDGQTFSNLIIPHVAVLGNHETGAQHHLRWPACVMTSGTPSYPKFIAANWMQLLFHWPYGSQGFYSEFRPDHPNLDPAHRREGYGKGGFGKLSFGDYLLLIALDNNQNWEGTPEVGLRDWQGKLITEQWPWFETQHADVRQDLWLKNLLEPTGGPAAGQRYTHILPIWHRGLFGTNRLNMTYKNRGLLEFWYPILYRNGVKVVKECHDHLYSRSVPIGITPVQPPNTYLQKRAYTPISWTLPASLTQNYLDEFFTVNVARDNQTHAIVGWEYKGHFACHDPQGLVAIGCGGWAASRSNPGGRKGGEMGLWFVDPAKGGETFGGNNSFHMTTVHLTAESVVVESFRPGELTKFENNTGPQPIHRLRWSIPDQAWAAEKPAGWEFYSSPGQPYLTAYQLWSAGIDWGAIPESQRGPLDDPDGDSRPNLLERALGSDPTLPDATEGLSYAVMPAMDGRLQFKISYRRAAAQMTYVLKHSLDLVTWSDAGVSEEQFDAVSGEHFRTWLAPSEAAAAFVRIEVR